MNNYNLLKVGHNHPSGNGPGRDDIRNAVFYDEKVKLFVYVNGFGDIPYNTSGIIMMKLNIDRFMFLLLGYSLLLIVKAEVFKFNSYKIKDPNFEKILNFCIS
jgi:hypothetical protein